MVSQKHYSAISIINHWITVILVITMLTLGFAAVGAPSDEVEDYVMSIHIALGFFVFLFIAWRIAFRLYEGFPEREEKTAIERWAAYIGHRTLLLLLGILVITGPMYLLTENECIDVFGWFSVCVPLEGLDFMHEAMEWLHVVIGLYLLPALIVIHTLAGIRHYILSDADTNSTDI
ncbi:MAG: cytochrome b/b6 domain-containing protein [Gammaproteobacteria bacterium]|nr:cytochrome b/b6 domain-containing protein [Gammaproteobacteria bacterium]